MSTRATYQFTSEDSDPRFQLNAVVYIHHDGYPSGAASHFYNALILPNQSGWGPEVMIRSNEEAEITKSHEIHGDTEYRYDLIGWGADAKLKAYEREFSQKGRDIWKNFYVGILADFIHQHREKLFVENYSQFVEVPYHFATRWMNRETAKHLLGPNPEAKYDDSIMGHIKSWGGMYQKSANWDSMIDSYRQIVNAFPELEIPGFEEAVGVNPFDKVSSR